MLPVTRGDCQIVYHANVNSNTSKFYCNWLRYTSDYLYNVINYSNLEMCDNDIRLLIFAKGQGAWDSDKVLPPPILFGTGRYMESLQNI